MLLDSLSMNVETIKKTGKPTLSSILSITCKLQVLNFITINIYTTIKLINSLFYSINAYLFTQQTY